MAIQLKTPAQIAKLRDVNLIVNDVLDTLEAAAAPGVSTWELDQVAAKHLKHLGGESAFLGYRGYPAVLCASVNEVVVHGIPRKDVVPRKGICCRSTSAPSRTAGAAIQRGPSRSAKCLTRPQS